ncbi:hypothetical protein CXF59_03275 [Flavobacterium sp. ALD4]|jgi:hypothetical protein|uniref:DUF4258 domain-containing protein n=1 Tax=Flavobacterium sp. ALD4 TaxID=2058314 RepID=UPI000C333BD2|nr:DUF4258 domain-containing protein [Flavobacterium sp. ALD4]PKH68367.1 hypothetical protein CXF59_03275 [Flavobacterium sp. ALD4]
MKFFHRFAYYLVGLVIGIFFVSLIFSGKDTRCNYFPNARVLNDIRNKPFDYSAKASKVLAEKWIDTIDIKNTLEFGDVDFDKSNTEFRKAKLFVIEGKTTKNQAIILKISNREDKAILEEIIKK